MPSTHRIFRQCPACAAIHAASAFKLTGGGGFGNPLDRPPDRVLGDVRSGYVSVEAAARDYGVVVRQDGRIFTLDIQATQRLRALSPLPRGRGLG